MTTRATPSSTSHEGDRRARGADGSAASDDADAAAGSCSGEVVPGFIDPEPSSRGCVAEAGDTREGR